MSRPPPPPLDMARISKRVFGNQHTKPCRDKATISCRKFLCQRANRCMMEASRAHNATLPSEQVHSKKEP